MTAVRVLAGLVGAGLVAAALSSAVTTVVLPRAVPNRLVRIVFIVVSTGLSLRAGRAPTYERRDRVFAPFAPVSLLLLVLAWLLAVWLGGAALVFALSGSGARHALYLSGSSVLTLGFSAPHGAPVTAVAFGEAALGLVLVALLITYLPTLYGAFSRREAAVTTLQVRAGSPPSGTGMLVRAHAIGEMTGREVGLREVWRAWEGWFVDVEESHTSFPSLVFFRSPQPDHSWVTAAGAVLDGAALVASSLRVPRQPEAELCIRAGYLALRRICDFYGIRYQVRPLAGDAITVTRAEYEQALDELAAAGVAVRPDRDEAWHDFAGWRVNYDVPLVALAGLVYAPYAPWSSDRSLVSGDPRAPLRLRALSRASWVRPGRPAG